jgi:hypothetical protein
MELFSLVRVKYAPSQYSVEIRHTVTERKRDMSRPSLGEASVEQNKPSARFGERTVDEEMVAGFVVMSIEVW